MGLILGRLGGPLLQWAFAAAFLITAVFGLIGYGSHKGSMKEASIWTKAVAAKEKDDRAANYRVDQQTLQNESNLDERERQIRRNWATAGRTAPTPPPTSGVTIEKGAN